MDTSLILVKTGKGVEEVKSRSFGLSQALRALLIMADGSISMAGLLSRAAQTPKAEESLQWLLQEGFVESIPPGSRRAASGPNSTFGPQTSSLPATQALIAMTRELLGPDATKVIERLADVPDSPLELGAAIDRCHKFIKLTIDEAKAQKFLKGGQALLAEYR